MNLNQLCKSFRKANNLNVVEEREPDYAYYEELQKRGATIEVVFAYVDGDGNLKKYDTNRNITLFLPKEQLADYADSTPDHRGRYLVHTYEVRVESVDRDTDTVNLNYIKVENERRLLVTTLLVTATQKAYLAVEREHSEQIEDGLAEKFQSIMKEAGGSANLQDKAFMEEVDRRLDLARKYIIFDIIEEHIHYAVTHPEDGKRQYIGEEKSHTRVKLTDLIVPVRVFAPREKNCWCEIMDSSVRGMIHSKMWAQHYVSDFERAVTRLKGEYIDVAVLGVHPSSDEHETWFKCSRRALLQDPWDIVENYYSKGAVVRVRCVQKRDNKGYYYAQIKEDTQWVPDCIKELQIMCNYYTGGRKEIAIVEGGEYMCKVVAVSGKERKFKAVTFDIAKR